MSKPTSEIARLGEALTAAFEAHGVRVSENLQPGLAKSKILRIAEPLGFDLPPEVIDLYRWKNGHIDDEDSSLHRLVTFRDNAFLSLERGIEEHFEMRKYYGTEEATLERVGVDMRTCFPIGAFMGSWTAVACGKHKYGKSAKYPVINVFQGYDYYFDSVTAMLKTCVGWVSSPEWEQFGGLPDEIEGRLWKLHNPNRPRYGA